MPQIISTLTAGQNYHIYETGKDSNLNVIKKTIAIKGGANNARRGGESGVITPQGVITEVSEDDLALLMKDENFKLHLDGGHLKVSNEKVKVSKAVKDMKDKDESAPLVDKDFKEGGRAGGDAPTTGKIS